MNKILITLITLVSVTGWAQKTNVISIGKASKLDEKVLLVLKTEDVFLESVVRSSLVKLKIYEHLYKFKLYKKGESLKFDYSTYHANITKISGKALKVEIENKKNRVVERTLSIDIAPGEINQSANLLADAVYRGVTKQKSIFLSKIVFISDKHTRDRRKIIKEVYLSNYDGTGLKRLTKHKAITVSPVLSPDKTKVLYTLIKRVKGVSRIRLYEKNLTTGVDRIVSEKVGINSGGVYDADNNNIFLTLSYAGNADIYKMNLATKNLFRITKNPFEDVSPSVNSKTKLLTFISNRSGKPMVYTMNKTGTELEVKRVSFTGKFNGNPVLSPVRDEIVFSSWLDRRFDLFRIDSSGKNLIRLTRNQGSNEGSSFSADGEFIIYSSQKVITRNKAVRKLRIMNREGKNLWQIAQSLGNCQSPFWSK